MKKEQTSLEELLQKLRDREKIYIKAFNELDDQAQDLEGKSWALAQHKKKLDYAKAILHREIVNAREQVYALQTNQANLQGLATFDRALKKYLSDETTQQDSAGKK